jgi:hypothetical protein
MSFPFDLNSEAVFDSYTPFRSNAVPLPCHDHAVLKAFSKGHGRFAARERLVKGMVCVN